MSQPTATADSAPDCYRQVLTDYLTTQSEDARYRCSVLSKSLVEGGLGPEDILALHVDSLGLAISDLTPIEQLRATDFAHQFLLEVMIAYGTHYREYLELRLTQALSAVEAESRIDRERALEAERLGREREDILAMIAHELRTPIAATMSNIDLTERLVRQGNVEQASAFLDRAREGLHRLSRLSADLVEASRGEPPALTFSEVDLGQIVQQACTWVRPAAASKGVILDVELEGPPLLVQGNADALLSIIGNLVSNGVRYTLGEGTVTIRCGRDDASFWIQVDDTGIGIDPEAQDHIFEKFFRAQAAKNIEARGLGLGLSLARELVDAHNGKIDVSSEPGHGSTFKVVIPRRQPDGVKSND